MRGGYGKQEFLHVFSFVSTGVEEKGTYRYVKENWPVSRSVEGWEEGFAVFIYTPAFDVS